MSTHRITTPFGAQSTAGQVVDGVDLTGKRAIVTGGASGIGVETARALAGAGAEVTLAVRDVEAGERTAAQITPTTGSAGVLVAPLDLADQASVAAFVAGWRGPLHILVDNAGIMATPELRTPRGWELQFATNHLGHFALATGLRDSLAAAGGARVVVVSSVGHVNADVDFDDIHFRRRPYDKWTAYGQSKTANVLFAVEAARRWATGSIAVNALNPGRITGTNLSRHIGDVSSAPASFDPASTDVSWKTVEQGAATSVLLAASPLVDGVTGRYFEDCEEAVPYRAPVRRGVAGYALDPGRAARLWQVSLDTLATRNIG
ncbi:SDR family NAD(P)-dependent oxidoreductase [Amycolatopsis acidiphila]|uniref:Probable oxidoreductase n=1 Tax=Amycolatopsis acidiphila TaxID=715473 RepID=A0A557ZYU5_9PSEU|nr:SDR family NAD(P)-dependent oxidoreductase [Amycolatopsis acidiphila]TVT17179.1 SDR family NAD(P)-dependent oxidoreductase [Amycolatopsis acidiphila]UIJ63060.1 SDR family NAD(P)-dependent oxidoreductase [Amycolatopsis acidiphila]GHG65907.1 oxidoreductase [Amycolatopsis acidiphila]